MTRSGQAEDRPTRILERAWVWSRQDNVKFYLLIVAGLIAWYAVLDAYPLRPVVSRYVEF